MSLSYLLSLNYTYFICKAVELPIPLVAWLLRWRALESFLSATQGSVDAACMALEHGWAINLGGGFHHATRSSGGGFCIYPDITFITHYLEKWYDIERFCIIDLDAHQGNGHERDHTDKSKHYIIDAYNHMIYPGDQLAKRWISDDIDVDHTTTDYEFALLVKTSLRKCFETFKP